MGKYITTAEFRGSEDSQIVAPKAKDTRKRVLCFCHSCPKKNWAKTEDFSCFIDSFFLFHHNPSKHTTNIRPVFQLL